MYFLREDVRLNMKKFLTIFYYNDVGPQHFYKDVGSIPLGLAKFRGWKAFFAYSKIKSEIHDDYYEKYVSVIPIEAKKHHFFSMVCFLWNNIKKYDVLNIYHFGKKSLICCFVAKMRNPKIIIYIKFDAGRQATSIYLKRNTNFFYRLIMKLTFKLHLFPDLFTVETKSYVNKLWGITRGKIQYLPNGVWGDLPGMEDIQNTKEKVILNVGRLTAPEKNIKLLIDSFVKIPDSVRLGWKLVLIGEYNDEIETVARNAIRQEPSLQGKIIFVGEIRNKILLNQYYANAAIYGLTSKWESFGISLLEAMYQGCFPIVTDCCDAFYDILGEGKYGCIIPNENEKAFSRALCTAMIDFDYTVKQGMQAKKFVSQNFDYKVITAQLEKFLDELIHEESHT